jgi:serine protease Do
MASSRTWPLTIRVILVSTAVSLAGGVLAAAVTVGSFSDYATALGELVSPLRISTPRSSEESEASFERLRDKALSTMALLSFTVPGSDGIDPADTAGAGVVLTSDGWIATSFVRAPVKAVLVGRRSYAVERTASDPGTGILFLKTDARNLPAATFGNPYAMRPGQAVYLAEGETALRRTSVISFTRAAAMSSDRPARRFVLEGYVGDNGAGAFDAQGNLFALSGSEGVVPLDVVLSAFRALVKDGTVDHATLGASFLDLSVAVAVPTARTNGRESGVLITFVGKGTAAEAGGLRVGDIVTAADGHALDEFFSLDDVVGAAAVGQELALSVERAGSTTDLRVRLR